MKSCTQLRSTINDVYTGLKLRPILSVYIAAKN